MMELPIVKYAFPLVLSSFRSIGLRGVVGFCGPLNAELLMVDNTSKRLLSSQLSCNHGASEGIAPEVRDRTLLWEFIFAP